MFYEKSKYEGTEDQGRLKLSWGSWVHNKLEPFWNVIMQKFFAMTFFIIAYQIYIICH